jgi:phage tail protein X
MQYIVKRIDETLDEIVYRNYGSSFSYVELVLQTNIFLYEQGIYLKQGLVIELPEVKKEAQGRVTLWS